MDVYYHHQVSRIKVLVVVSGSLDWTVVVERVWAWLGGNQGQIVSLVQ